MKRLLNNQLIYSEPFEGPLAAYITSFTEQLCMQGYARYTLQRHVKVSSDFSRWLGRKGISLENVSSEYLTHYLKCRARRQRLKDIDAPALDKLLAFLRQCRAVPAERSSENVPSPIEEAVREFSGYLRKERALSERTIAQYERHIRRLITLRFPNGPVQLRNLSAQDIIDFVKQRSRVTRARQMMSALRAFVKYACFRGDVSIDLIHCVPAVSNCSLSSIPRAITPEHARQVLRSCDRRSVAGRRDYAILLLLARLGLRAGEVVMLTLDDIDWKAGTLRVHGKAGRRMDLPLPEDVGKALSSYLQHRPHGYACRRLFLTDAAPVRGLVHSSAIASLVRRALERAGIHDAVRKGAHQFRHALAAQLLRRGASLSEIGDVLGHRRTETTMIYAKVDLQALRRLALPWPGGAQ